jgi:hypothetical protein
MRIVTWVAAAAALLVGVPVALAHEGSPNFLSQVNQVTPAAPGVDVEVLNRDDRLLLRNSGDATVLIEGYDGEPYARIEPDGTVSVNTDSKAYYINEERDGEVAVPGGVDGKGEPRWKEVSKTGRFEWHDHRMHYMGKGTPPGVKDKGERQKLQDYAIPIRVGSAKGSITGAYWWSPQKDGGPPVGAIVALVVLVLAGGAAVVVTRRRRARSAPADGEPVEAW